MTRRDTDSDLENIFEVRAMSEMSLRGQLVGAWELTSYVERDVTTGEENHPFGERPVGLILYTPDGYMSAQLQRADRAPFAEGDLLRARPEEYAAAGNSYLAYSGRFFVDEGKKSLIHEMAVSFFPNWFGRRTRPCKRILKSRSAASYPFHSVAGG